MPGSSQANCCLQSSDKLWHLVSGLWEKMSNQLVQSSQPQLHSVSLFCLYVAGASLAAATADKSENNNTKTGREEKNQLNNNGADWGQLGPREVVKSDISSPSEYFAQEADWTLSLLTPPWSGPVSGVGRTT